MRIIVSKVVLTLIDTVTIGYSTTVSDTSPTTIIASTYKFQDSGGTGGYVDFDFTASAAGSVCFFVQSKNMWGGVQAGYLKTSAITITSPFPTSFTSVAPASGNFVKNIDIPMKITLGGVTADALTANIWWSTVNNDLSPTPIIGNPFTFNQTGAGVLSFNFKPTQAVGTDLYFYVKAIAGYATQLSYIVSAPITVVTPFPTSIASVTSPIIQLVNTTITLTLNGVTTGAPTADISYYASSGHGFPTSYISNIAFTSGNQLVFNFTALAGTTQVYFYVKAIETDGSTKDSGYLESTKVTINTPDWIPSATSNITSSVLPYILVVNSSVQVTFSFTAAANFPSTIFGDLFTLSDGTTAITSATVNTGNKSITISYTATSGNAITFTFNTIYGNIYQFLVDVGDIYTFPTQVTTKLPTTVNVGQTLSFTTTFSRTLEAGTTATVNIVPSGKGSVSPSDILINNAIVTYSMSVAHDVQHTGTVTLFFGSAQNIYTWSLSDSEIYSFPSSFTIDGSQNGYTGYHLKEGVASQKLVLTFSGGDMLFSNSVGTQINSIVFNQGSDTSVTADSCNATNETITITCPISPTTTQDITIKVVLKGYNGATSNQITKVLPVGQILGIGLSISQLLSTVNTFATTENASALPDFSANFKTALLVNLPTVSWGRYGYVCTGREISTTGSNTYICQFPSWSTTVLDTVYSSISNITANLKNMGGSAPVGLSANSIDSAKTTDSMPNVLMRYLWTFSSSKIVSSIAFYTSYPGWNSEYINMEVVGSNDGSTFVRIPAEWHDGASNTIEDTYHMKWNRKTKGGGYAWLFASNSVGVATDTSSTNNSSGKFMLNTTSAKPLIAFIQLRNNCSYKYYGFGQVGSTTPFYGVSASSQSTDASRYYAGCPAGDAYYMSNTLTSATLPNNWVHTSFVINGDLMANNMPWLTYQSVRHHIFPVVATSSAGISSTFYRHWRIRASSITLATLGSFSVYFWKMGLYRHTTSATNDNSYSPNNYIQNSANIITVNDGISSDTISSGNSKDRFVVSKPLWTDTSSLYLQTESIKVTFNNENAFFKISLDVTGDINIIRFPSFMYCDANKQGGGLILEASVDNSTWVPMVATKVSASQKLGIDGIFSTSSGNAAGNVTLLHNTFGIVSSTFVKPTNLNTPTIPGGVLKSGNLTSGCKITISGGGWSASSNIQSDFSVHCVYDGTATPYWPGNTPFNCTVTNYNTVSGELEFSITPLIIGTCRFAVFIRDGLGSGVISERLLSSSFTINDADFKIISTPSTIYATISVYLPLRLLSNASLNNTTVNIYYFTTRTEANPTLCGLGTLKLISGITFEGLFLCTFPTAGTYYIYMYVSSAYVCTTTTITVQSGIPSINFKSFSFASTSDAAAVTSTQTSFAAALPAGFTTTSTQTNLTILKSYYRDINGEWAPTLTPLVPRMIRMDYNAASSVVLNATATGFAVIIIQSTTYNTDNPSILWSTYPSSSKTAMCSVGGNTYVGPSVAPATAITFSTGVNSTGEIVTAVTRQTQVKFATARIAGESNRWYNGIKEAVAITAFDGSITQTPSLGAAGGVQLQDFITVHQFSLSMQMSLDSINNTTYTTIGSGTGNTTPYCCTTTTNRSGGARFAEFAVVKANLASDDLLSLANDYANKWRVPFAGPTIKTFRLVNTGTASLSIGDFGFGTKSDMSVNLLDSAAYGAATYSVSSGAASSAATWQGATLSTAPHQIIPAGGYLQIVLNSAIENAGFLQLGLVTFAAGAELVLDINYTSGVWERYDLYYNYGGVVVNTTTSLSPVGSSQTIYAKNGVLMPWKQKYRTNPNEDPNIPYNLPLYNISRESNISYLETLSSNLMGITWDADNSVKWIINTQTRTGTALSENQLIVFKNGGAGSGATLSQLITATTTTDGKYDLNAIEMTRYDYIPKTITAPYLNLISAALNSTDAANFGAISFDGTNLGMAFIDPTTLQAVHAVLQMNSEIMDINMRLRKSCTGKYYLDTPQVALSGTHRFVSPINGALRSIFGITSHDPAFGTIIDTLDLQKKYTICSFVCNSTLLFRAPISYPLIGDAFISGSTFNASVANSVCNMIVLKNFGNMINAPDGTSPVFTPPSYTALRSCTPSGGSPGEYTHASQERLYIVTIVIDTTVGGINYFNSPSTMETYAKIYINGKRINTSTRRVASGSNFVTCTTNVGTSPTSYPLYFYPSSALTYGISQVTDLTKNMSGNSSYGIKYSMPAVKFNSSYGKCFSNGGMPKASTRRSAVNSNNRLIVLETKTENRVSSSYLSSEVDTHIQSLSTKWGIVMAYRWVTIKNIGSVNFRFARLGFYGSHTEAYSDSTGDIKDPKTLTYINIMKGYSSVSYTSSLTTVGENGIDDVLSNTIDTIPGASDLACVNIQPGGWITIDLGDSITCSHVRFGKFASTGDVTTAKLIFELTQTLPEDETQGVVITHVLKASLNNSGVAYGQFPLYSGPIQMDINPFVNGSGVHLNTCGVYMLCATTPVTQTLDTSITTLTPNTASLLLPVTVTLTTNGSRNTAAIQSAYVYQSISSTDNIPSQIGTSAIPFTNTNDLTFTFTPNSLGNIYFYIKELAINGKIQSTYIVKADSSLVVSNSFPTSIPAVYPTSFIKDGLTNVTLSLANVTNGTTKANVYWGTTGNFAASTQISASSYNFSGNSITFPFTPSSTGNLYFFLKGIANDGTIQGSALSTSQLTVGSTLFPVSLTITPAAIIKDVSTTIKLILDGVISGTKADIYSGTSSTFGSATKFLSNQSFTGTNLTFAFTPTTAGTLYFFAVCIAADTSTTTVSNSITVTQFPTSIVSVVSTPDLAQYETSLVTLTLDSVNNGEPSAYVYWSNTNTFASAVLANGSAIPFSSTTLTFSFTPLTANNIFFFVKAVSTGNVLQPVAIISNVQTVLIPTLKNIYKTNGSGASLGVFEVDHLSSSLIVCYPGNTTTDVTNIINSSTILSSFTGSIIDEKFYMIYGSGSRTDLTLGGMVFDFGTNLVFNKNFTIEGWFRWDKRVHDSPLGNGGTLSPPLFYTNSTKSITVGINWTSGTGYSVSGGTRYNALSPATFGLRKLGTADTTATGTSYVVSPDSFFHVALTYDSTNYNIYINGVSYLTTTWSEVSLGTQLWIGNAFTVNDIKMYTTVKYTSNFNTIQLITGPYPSRISNIVSSLVKNGTSTVVIMLFDGSSQLANVYHSTSSGSGQTLIGQYSIIENTISFSFTPTTTTSLYFSIKAVFGVEVQSSYIEGPVQTVATPYPTSIVSVSPTSFKQGITSAVTLTLAGVTNGATTAYVYQYSSKDYGAPTQIGASAIAFSGNTLSFNFMPITTTSVYFYVGAVSNGITATPLLCTVSAFTVSDPYPTGIASVSVTPAMEVGKSINVIITLNGVNASTPKANIYADSTSGASSPAFTLQNNLTFSTNTLSFSFTPTIAMTGSFYFYVKAITTDNYLQPSFKVSSVMSVLSSLKPEVSFTTTNSSSFSFSSSNYLSEWSQTEPSGQGVANNQTGIGMEPARQNSGPVSGNAGVTVVQNIFNYKPGIYTGVLTSVNYCIVTQSEIAFGGGSDINLTYSMYLLCRPVASNAIAGYIAGYGVDYDGKTTSLVSSQFGRVSGGTMYTNTVGVSANTTELFRPGSGAYTYPNLSYGYEIWCFTKKAGSKGMEIYQNNVTVDSNQSSYTGPAYQLYNFWRLGCGSGYTGGGPSYIGAFRVYNTYHDSTTRAKVQTELQQLFAYGPTSFTYSVGTVYVTVPISVTLTCAGVDPYAGTIIVYASTNSSDTSPTAISASSALNNAGSATVTCTFPTAGTIYLFVKATDGNSLQQPLFVPTSSPVTVTSYSLPTSIASSSLTSLVVNTSISSQTLVLNGPNTANLVAANIAVYLNTTNTLLSNCSVTNYTPVSGTVTFTATPTVSGMNTLYVKITAPLASSTQSTTLSYLGISGQGFFIDAAGSTYTMPSAFSFS